jgi:hypothetical protein
MFDSKAYLKKWQKEKRELYRGGILRVLGNECVICGYKGVALEIDHVNGGGNKERKSIGGQDHMSCYQYYRSILEKIQSGSKDYQLLCATHNIEKKFAMKEM